MSAEKTKRPAADQIHQDRAKRAHFNQESQQEQQSRLDRSMMDRAFSARREDRDEGRRQSIDSYRPGQNPRDRPTQSPDGRRPGWNTWRPAHDAHVAKREGRDRRRSPSPDRSATANVDASPALPAEPTTTKVPQPPPLPPSPVPLPTSPTSGVVENTMSADQLAAKFVASLPDVLDAYGKFTVAKTKLQTVKSHNVSRAKFMDPASRAVYDKQQAEQEYLVQATREEFSTSIAAYHGAIRDVCAQLSASRTEDVATKHDLAKLQHQVARLLSRDKERENKLQKANKRIDHLESSAEQAAITVTGISGALTNRTERLNGMSEALTNRTERLKTLEAEQDEILGRMRMVEKDIKMAEKDVKSAKNDIKTIGPRIATVEKEVRDLKTDTETQVLGLVKHMSAFTGLDLTRLKVLPQEIELLRIGLQKAESTLSKEVAGIRKDLNKDNTATLGYLASAEPASSAQSNMDSQLGVQIAAILEQHADLETKITASFKAHAAALDEVSIRVGQHEAKINQMEGRTPNRNARSTQPTEVTSQTSSKLEEDVRKLQKTMAEYSNIIEHGLIDDDGVQHPSVMQRQTRIDDRLEELNVLVWQAVGQHASQNKDLQRERRTPAPTSDEPSLPSRIRALEKYNQERDAEYMEALRGQFDNRSLSKRLRTIANSIADLRTEGNLAQKNIDALTAKSLQQSQATDTGTIPQAAIDSLKNELTLLRAQEELLQKDVNTLKARPQYLQSPNFGTISQPVLDNLKDEVRQETMVLVQQGINAFHQYINGIQPKLNGIRQDVVQLGQKVDKMDTKVENLDKVRRTALQSLEGRYDKLTTVGMANQILEQLTPRTLAARDANYLLLQESVETVQAQLEALGSDLLRADRELKEMKEMPRASITDADIDSKLEAWWPEREKRIIAKFSNQWAEQFDIQVNETLKPEFQTLEALHMEMGDLKKRLSNLERAKDSIFVRNDGSSKMQRHYDEEGKANDNYDEGLAIRGSANGTPRHPRATRKPFPRAGGQKNDGLFDRVEQRGVEGFGSEERNGTRDRSVETTRSTPRKKRRGMDLTQGD